MGSHEKKLIGVSIRRRLVRLEDEPATCGSHWQEKPVCPACATTMALIVADATTIEENAMKFMCLICAEILMEQMTEADAEKHYEEYSEFTAAIKASGHFIGVNRLEPPEAATTVRVRHGKVSTTDGPFAETKELLGGYYVIDARDLNDAIQVASRIPGARIGCVEVRPIAEDARTLRALGIAAAGSR